MNKTKSSKGIVPLLAAFACLLALSGCAGNRNAPKHARGATAQGAPVSDVSVLVINEVDPPGPRQVRAAAGEAAVTGEPMTLPATYRRMVVDGKTVLVRETDPRRMLASPAVTYIAGDAGQGDVSVQPGLLPQELAAEIVRTRARSEALGSVLPQVLQRMDALAAEAKKMQEANLALVAHMNRVATYAQSLETRLAEAENAIKQGQGDGQAPATTTTGSTPPFNPNGGR
jgi:hypothetical protein